MDIESNSKTIQSCFLECLYEVPNFQRPYSWQEEQLEDFWNDVVLAKGDFFFGTTVTWVSRKRDLFSNTYSLIDGQQRLTTTMVALSVIRDSFDIVAAQLEADDSIETLARIINEQKDTTQKYLIAKDDNSAEYPVLTRPEPMFWEEIQKPGSIPSGATWDVSAKLVGVARAFFEGKIIKEVAAQDDVSSKIEKLKDLRNNILKAQVIQVELGSEEDAFLIFETLNTRGSDLRLADLVKNMLVRGISDDPNDRNAVASRWQIVYNDITRYGDNPEAIDRFIWQSWNSRRSAVKEPELYKQLLALIASGQLTLKNYLSQTEVDSQIYRHLETTQVAFPKKTSGVRQSLAIPEVQDSIRGLGIFNVTVANSAVVALLRKYNQCPGLVSEKQTKRAIQAIENFHFQFNAMANSGSTGGTRSRYNRFSVALEQASTRAEVSAAIDDFIGRLKGSLPANSIVENAFAKLAYAPRLTLTNAQKGRGSTDLIQYVLLTLAKRLGNLPPAQDISGWTIEHIVPQRGAGDSFEEPVYSIGNLALVSGATNSKLGHGSFAEKRRVIANSAFPRDDVLASWLDAPTNFEPTARDIEARAQTLASLASASIWSI